MTHFARGTIFAVLLAVAGPASGATFTVDSTADEIDVAAGDGACASAAGACTLRAAVMEANASFGPHVIDVTAGTYLLSVTGTGGAESGALDLGRAITVQGAGAALTVVDAGGIDRVFVENASTGGVVLRGLTIRGGRFTGSYGGGIRSIGNRFVMEDCIVEDNVATPGEGGGLGAQADSNLIRRCLFRRNTAAVGGAAYVTSSATFEDCRFEDNTGSTAGGAVATYTRFGSATFVRCEFANNDGGSRGGAILNQNAARLDDCTLEGNTAGSGGGIHFDDSFGTGSTLLFNCTLSGNRASRGGGFVLASLGRVQVMHSTVTLNEATSSHGGFSGGTGVVMQASILAGNLAPSSPDCNAPTSTRPQSDGDNLIGDAGCVFTGTTATDIRGVDPLLSPLADNGGPVRTHAVRPGSRALDEVPLLRWQGRDVLADARGEPRPSDGNGDGTSRSDIGAYELQPLPATGLAIRRSITLGPTGATPPLADAFVPSCPASAWTLCPETVEPGVLGALVLAGEAASVGAHALWLYEHSDVTDTMKLARQGSDLAFLP